MAYRPHPRRASVDATRPQAWATCARCGFISNHVKLRWQFDFRGQQLQNLNILVCSTCYDQPQNQLRPVILPPDPVPIQNPRPEPYAADEVPVTARYTMNGRLRITSGTPASVNSYRIISGDTAS